MNVKVDSERGSYAKITMIFFFRPQGSVHVLDACHKCGSGRDCTSTMHIALAQWKQGLRISNFHRQHKCQGGLQISDLGKYSHDLLLLGSVHVLDTLFSTVQCNTYQKSKLSLHPTSANVIKVTRWWTDIRQSQLFSGWSSARIRIYRSSTFANLVSHHCIPNLPTA